jgi:hypothetical protein
MIDLRIGAGILREAVDLEAVKQERLERSKKEEKAVAAAAANNVGLSLLPPRIRILRKII